MSEETLGIFRGLATVLAMIAFVAVAAWAWSRRRKESFERAAQSPLEEDTVPNDDSPARAGATGGDSRRQS